MASIHETPEGTYRVAWREPDGRQRARTFKTKREAREFKARTEVGLSDGSYVDPHRGRRILLRDFAATWQAGRTVEETTDARTRSIVSGHVLPRWGSWPLAKIDHTSVQRWVRELSEVVAPATVKKIVGVLSLILGAAVRSQLLPRNPCDGVTLPTAHRAGAPMETITREEFATRLLPAIPAEYRALVCVAAGCGLRWGECAGLAWDAVDLVGAELHVRRVAVEVSGRVSVRPYPKTRAGFRTVPMPDFVVSALTARQDERRPRPSELVFATRAGTPIRRPNFRRVWRRSLVRAGLLGEVAELGPDKWRATWPDETGFEWSKEFTTEREAAAHVAEHGAGGLRFHGLRHSYATWLVSDGVPINVVRRLLGHEQMSTTVNRYTHDARDYDDLRVRAVFKRTNVDDSLTG